ncbi:hypothetical protein K1719_017492 [Acacia pycnantha]|nr:hypothetical protein K1719_017492 [Acacia pycnantha]
MAAIDLTPQLAKKVYGGDGGSYYAWSPSELPMLHHGNIGAAKLALEKNGFALPRYSNSSMVAYVLQGNGVVGIIMPESEEKIIAIKKGDALALPFGVVTWWYNKDDTELVVLFLGDTSKAHKAGEFTNFFLTGSNGIFTGFSNEFVGRAWDLEEKDVKTIVGSQSSKGIVKLDSNIKLPEPKPDHRNGMALNCLEAPLDVDIKEGGRVVVLNTKNLPLVGEVGLGADLVRIDGVPCALLDSHATLPCKLLILSKEVVVFKLLVQTIANSDGMEWFSIITTPNPIFTHLAGSSSVWKALSPTVLQAGFNVDSKLEQLFRSKRTSDAIFFPPPK